MEQSRSSRIPDQAGSRETLPKARSALCQLSRRAADRAQHRHGGGLGGPAWLEAVLAQGNSEIRPLVTELAVEPLELPRRTGRGGERVDTEEARYVTSIIAGVRLALVEAQVAELKARLQRTNPVEEEEAYHQLFGDLVPLEQYRIALRNKAAR